MRRRKIATAYKVAHRINTLQFNEALCTGCGKCAEVCPHGVYRVDNRVVTVVRADACMECGACQLNCPFDAILVDSGVGCASAMMIDALQGRRPDQWGSNRFSSCG